MEHEPNTAEEAAALAVERTKKAQEAIEASRAMHAEISDEKISRALSKALRDVFGENTNSGRFIDTNRIPLICQDIRGIHGEVSDIKDNLKWIVRLIIGAVVTALLGLVLIK